MPVLRPLFVSFAGLTLATGVLYPALVTGLARTLFPRQSGGSLLVLDGQVRGSVLIGQSTEDPAFFWGRPSLTAPYPTNAAASAGSTLAPSNPALAKAVAGRMAALRAANPDQPDPVPQDLVTASASGLDPHISPEGARWQVPRLARARKLPEDRLLALVEAHTERLATGAAQVNVLRLNAALVAGI